MQVLGLDECGAASIEKLVVVGLFAFLVALGLGELGNGSSAKATSQGNEVGDVNHRIARLGPIAGPRDLLVARMESEEFDDAAIGSSEEQMRPHVRPAPTSPIRSPRPQARSMRSLFESPPDLNIESLQGASDRAVFIGMYDPEMGKHRGSGTLMRAGDLFFVMTNHHVAKPDHTVGLLETEAGNELESTGVLGRQLIRDENDNKIIDIALIAVDPESLDERTRASALEISDIQNQDFSRMVVVGYPATNGRELAVVETRAPSTPDYNFVGGRRFSWKEDMIVYPARTPTRGGISGGMVYGVTDSGELVPLGPIWGSHRKVVSTGGGQAFGFGGRRNLPLRTLTAIEEILNEDPDGDGLASYQDLRPMDSDNNFLSSNKDLP